MGGELGGAGGSGSGSAGGAGGGGAGGGMSTTTDGCVESTTPVTAMPALCSAAIEGPPVATMSMDKSFAEDASKRNTWKSTCSADACRRRRRVSTALTPVMATLEGGTFRLAAVAITNAMRTLGAAKASADSPASCTPA